MPPGIYVDNEYPLHIKRCRDRLRPILQLAKKNPNYRDKSKLENDKLVINGTRYTLNDLHKLPEDLPHIRQPRDRMKNIWPSMGNLVP